MKRLFKLPGIAGALAGGSLLFFFASFFMLLPLYVSAPAALVGAGIGMYLLAGIEVTKKGKKKIKVRKGRVRKEELARYLNNGYEYLEILKKRSATIGNVKIQSVVNDLCGEISSLLDSLRKDPDDFNAARRFLDYIFMASKNILDQVHILEKEEKITPETLEIIRRTEDTMVKITGAVRKQHGRLLQNNILDLETELKVLENVIQSDGFI